MKITVNEAMFKDQFKAYGREDNFSSAGLSALYTYFEELEQDTGDELELDVIGLYCDFTEEDYSDIAENYDIDLSGCEGDEGFAAVLEYLTNETMVVYADSETGMILYQNF